MNEKGKVITFYSFKGGVGRSMALANIACLLAKKHNKRVLMLDWDLDAPGLHQFFCNMGVSRSDKGLIDFFAEIQNIIELRLENADNIHEMEDNEVSEILDSIKLNDYIRKTEIPSLDMITCGRKDEKYSSLVRDFDWVGLFKKAPNLFYLFAERLTQIYQYVLIDSRTGYTDTSGICTMLMPEILVLVFTPNRQSISGVIELLRKATDYRKESDDFRPLMAFPLPTRLDNAELERKNNWRMGNENKQIKGYQPEFETAFKEIYGLTDCDLDSFFDKIQVPYIPYYAYGEEIAVLLETGDEINTLSEIYENFKEYLLFMDSPWGDIEEYKNKVKHTKILVANLYNPHEQTKEQLIQSFVVRRNVFKKLFTEIKFSDMKHPEQHFLIVGQRGMGKTTLLLRLGYEVENDNDLNSWLIPVVLKEESYWGITRLFKLWETIAKELETKDKRFSGLFARMEAAYTDDDDYERIIFEILIRELQTHSQKMLLLIDNLAEMFRSFSDTECHHLREILMTCPHLRMIGSTAIVLEAFFTYQHSFYEFFKKEHLEGLSKEETRCFLENLSKFGAGQKSIRHILEHQQGRTEALRIMTGGVLRTIILLFEIFIDNENGNAIGDLESILDRVTPLYKHRMDDLAPMQREVVNVIALNWDAISIEEIAKKMRMKTDDITPILQGLDRVEIIQRAASDTQLNLYFLKERFFNIWYLMRVAPKGSQNKVKWLVRFLESWYDKNELVHRAKRHIDALCKGNYNPKGAYYLTEALAWTGKLDMDVEHELINTTKMFLTEKDKDLAEDLSLSDKELFEEGYAYYNDKKYDNALNAFLKIKNMNCFVCILLGNIYYELNIYEQSKEYFLKASLLEETILEENRYAFYALGYIYNNIFKDFGQAEKYYLMAINKGDIDAIHSLGRLYEEAFKYKEAEKYYLMAITHNNIDAMNSLGWLYYEKFKNYKEAENYLKMAVEKGHPLSMNNFGVLYAQIYENFKEAEKYFLMAIDKGEKEHALINLAQLYAYRINNEEKAEEYFLMSVENDNIRAMNELAQFYFRQRIKKGDALKYAKKSVEKDKNSHNTSILSCIYLWHDNIEEAKQIEKHFMYDKQLYDKFEDDIILYLMLILAKEQYQHVTQYFKDPELNLKERFKPLYYALLHFTDNKDFHKMPPELAEPVKDIIEKVRQMAADYA